MCTEQREREREAQDRYGDHRGDDAHANERAREQGGTPGGDDEGERRGSQRSQCQEIQQETADERADEPRLEAADDRSDDDEDEDWVRTRVTYPDVWKETELEHGCRDRADGGEQQTHRRSMNLGSERRVRCGRARPMRGAWGPAVSHEPSPRAIVGLDRSGEGVPRETSAVARRR